MARVQHAFNNEHTNKSKNAVSLRCNLKLVLPDNSSVVA